jgi:hypothetical protein
MLKRGGKTVSYTKIDVVGDGIFSSSKTQVENAAIKLTHRNIVSIKSSVSDAASLGKSARNVRVSANCHPNHDLTDAAALETFFVKKGIRFS